MLNTLRLAYLIPAKKFLKGRDVVFVSPNDNARIDDTHHDAFQPNSLYRTAALIGFFTFVRELRSGVNGVMPNLSGHPHRVQSGRPAPGHAGGHIPGSREGLGMRSNSQHLAA